MNVCNCYKKIINLSKAQFSGPKILLKFHQTAIETGYSKQNNLFGNSSSASVLQHHETLPSETGIGAPTSL